MTDPQPEKKPVVNYNVPGNSNKSKNDPAATGRPAKLKKIIDGDVVQRKPSLTKRFREAFTGDDSRSVGDFVLFNVIVPALKQLISDAASSGLDRLLFGGDSRGGPRRGYTNYRSVSTPIVGGGIRDPRANVPIANPRAVHNFDEIVIPDRASAEAVIDALAVMLDQFGQATVSDLYELVGITGAFTDDKWGWTNLATARAKAVHGGFILDMPRTEPLA